MPRFSRPFVAAALGGIASIGVALRLHLALAAPFWFDEAFSWNLARLPLAELVDRVARDNHSPLYFALLHAWTRLAGTSVLAMRVPSIALGAAGALSLYWLCARAIEGRRGQIAGLAASLFAACAPALVEAGAEARMYPLALFAAAWASYFLLRAVERAGDARAWALYGAAAAFAFYAHYFSLFAIAAHLLFAAGVAVARRRVPLAALAAPCAFLLLTAPWLPTFFAQRAATAGQWWAPPITLPWVERFWLLLFTETRAWPSLWLLTLLDLALLGLLVFFFARTRGRERLLLLMAPAIFATSALASIHAPNLVVLHYLTFSVLFLCAAAGALVSRLPGRGLPVGVAAILACAGGRLALAGDSGGAPEFGEIAAHLAQQRAPVIIDPFDYFTLRYYAPEAAWAVYGEGGKVTRFNGAALLGPGDRVMGAAEVAALRGRFVLVENQGGFGTRHVPAPPGARTVATRTFGSGRERVSVTEYEAAPARDPAPAGTR